MTTHDLEGARQAAAAIPCGPAERVPLPAALGRVLAMPLSARVDLPTADTVAMDGWAVSGEGPWRKSGSVLVGGQPPALRPGEAVRVATGSLVPDGTVGVVRREHGTVRDGVLHGTARATDVRATGEQCRRGEVVLPAGRRLRPGALGLAAACGHDSLDVVTEPRVAALVLGDEVVQTGLPAPGQVRDAVGPQLRGWVAAGGGVLGSVTPVLDDLAATRAALTTAVADVVVVVGGTSVGDRDHLRPALAALGAQLVVSGVDVRPGHPMLLAVLPDGRRVVGLPGNPLAAVAGIVVLLLPLLAGLTGTPLRTPVDLRLVTDLAARGGPSLVPVALTDGGALPLPHAGAAMLRGVAHADGLALAGTTARRTGDVVPVLLLPT